MSCLFWRSTFAIILSILTLPFAAGAALAGGGVGVTFGFGGGPYYGHHRPPVYYGPPPPVYYRGPIYAPPPVYYAPPVYAAPPVYYAPPAYSEPAPRYAPQLQRENCREYQSTGVVNGAVAQTYGTACQQPDGTWRIVN